MAFHDDLLEQASHLASREPRRPRQASLRRAISSAYYALFHLLVAEAARRLSPSQPPLLRPQIGRAFAHRDMGEVCERFAEGSPVPATARLISQPLERELRDVARAFVELQNARYSADYDLFAPFDRLAVLQKVEAARHAFAAWDVIKGCDNASVFLAAMLLQRQWRSRQSA